MRSSSAIRCILRACLTLGVLPVLFLVVIINSAARGDPPIPWPALLGGSAVVAAVGVGLMVICPHGASFDHQGNIFVVEWVEVGRVTKLRRLA